MIRKTALIGGLLLGVVGVLQPTFGQSNEYHGAESIFKANGIVVVWAIEKRGNDESPLVYLRIVRTPAAGVSFNYYSVLAVDPFSKSTRAIVVGKPMENENTVTAELAAFQDYSARRVQLYRTEDDVKADKPNMVVFYHGVPDTSPEFLSKQKLESYFSDTVRRLEGTN